MFAATGEPSFRIWSRKIQRLVERIPSVLVILAAYLHTRLAPTRGIAFVDSFP